LKDDNKNMRLKQRENNDIITKLFINTRVNYYSIPKDKNSDSQTGEDSFSYSNSTFVVCDGVGGWRKLGVDPSLFSNSLCAETNN